MNGKVLVTIIPEEKKKPDWAEVSKHPGWLNTEVDAVEWQRKTRDEWRHRP